MFSGDLVEHTGFEPVTPTLPEGLNAFYSLLQFLKTYVITRFISFALLLLHTVYRARRALIEPSKHERESNRRSSRFPRLFVNAPHSLQQAFCGGYAALHVKLKL